MNIRLILKMLISFSLMRNCKRNLNWIKIIFFKKKIEKFYLL